MSVTADIVSRWASLAQLSVPTILEHWSERAAIREYCGGQTREDAEIGALGDVREIYAARCVSPRQEHA